MGTTPQNPPPGQYPPQDPKQARAWARAQRQQMRAQRQYWLAYGRGGRRPSITGPIVLMAIGVVALLVEMGRLNGFRLLNWYMHWWPVLLIAVGLISLLEYFLDRGDAYAGRRAGGGFVVLILLLALVGWGAKSAHWLQPIGQQFGMNGNDILFTFGDEHDKDLQMTQAATAGGTVNVQNPHGDVTVTPSQDGQIHVQAHEMVHTWSGNDVQRVFDAVRPQITPAGPGVVVSVPWHRGAAVDLTLAVPAGSFLTVNVQHGDVSVEGLKNAADVTDGQGDVKFGSMGGDVNAHIRNGDFSAHAIQGQVAVSGQGSDVTLSEIRGQAVIDGEFFGDTHLEEMSGSIHFHSRRTSIDVPKLNGDLTLDSDDLTADQLSGPVRITTRSKNIELTQVAGDLQIQDRDGDVNVTTAAPLGNVSIQNQTGDLMVTVPENARFTVAASTTQDSDLQTDFPLQVTTSGDKKQMEGTVGRGGVRLDLSTTHGDLKLHKGSAEMAPSAVPAAAPEPPKGPVRHLRAPKTPVAVTEE
ncbi:MAG TPA: DUF4097 family beta strand repeat-containing protein [Acidobacteriaceae bacterium]|nr:DUF4097 family beta strand repeat-containing protein [Acidobacteriaceae bacterium]